MSVRKFETLTRRGKAVRVAKDVIAQINLDKYKAAPGTYFRHDSWKDTESVKEVLADGASCRVCAIGAAFASVCKLNGDGKDWWSRSRMVNHMSEVFDVVTASLLERAFEVWKPTEFSLNPDQFPDYGNAEQQWAAYKYGAQYKRPDERMRAIMQNIIDNRGVFRP